jgi:predicted Fe-S protein YdhL (DUF1289 family)
METHIASPCRTLCALDAERQRCTGCGRTLGEIARWTGMSEAQRAAVMARVRDFPSPLPPPARPTGPSA